MGQEELQELSELLRSVKITDKEKLDTIKKHIKNEEYDEALKMLRQADEEIEEEEEFEDEDYEDDYDLEDEEEDQDNEEEESDEEDYEEDDEDDEEDAYEKEYGSEDESKYEPKDDEDEYDDFLDEDMDQFMKVDSIYPEELSNITLEQTYLGLLLNNPQLITKYYMLHSECAFESQLCFSVYKSILLQREVNIHRKEQRLILISQKTQMK